MWKEINEFFNFYGGLIGVLSLFFAVFTYVRTGQIKKNIKNLLSHSRYEKQKKKTRCALEGVLDSIQKDDIFDKKILGEIHREISVLEHYRLFFGRKMSKNIKNINKILKKNCSEINIEKLTVDLNKIIGDLQVDEEYFG